MRHKVYGKHLGRDKNQRTALFRDLVRALFLHESIITTQAKAKAIKGLVDKLITKGKDSSSASKRVISSALPQKEISKKLIEEIILRYPQRKSGFTQIVKLGTRPGDGAMMVKMSLISADHINPDKQKIDKSVPQKEKTKQAIKVKKEKK